MAYLAMARKWRPKNFEDMVGQDHIAQTIRNAIEGKRISHAYLFTGTRGVGKTTSARILAKALNCKNGPTPTPCDACENCKAVNSGSSLDVLEIDGASNNSVDDIRELREQVNYAPMNGSYKIYVIDEVHMLTKNAFNALLKTLEEPPPHVVFIFATTEVNKVPHTILSRVQRFDFKRISEQHIRERLEYICAREGIKAQREALEAVARKGDGSMRDSLSLFDQVYAYCGADFSLEAARKVLGLPREELFDALIRSLVQHDQKACFGALQDAQNEGIEVQDFLIAFGEFLRNLLFSRQGVGPAALGLSEARHAELAALAPELRDGDLIRYAKLISDTLASLKASAHPRLAAELGLARMAALDRMVTLSQVLGAGIAPAPGGAPGGAPAGTEARPAPDLAEVKKKSPDPIAPPRRARARPGYRRGYGRFRGARPARTAGAPGEGPGARRLPAPGPRRIRFPVRGCGIPFRPYGGCHGPRIPARSWVRGRGRRGRFRSGGRTPRSFPVPASGGGGRARSGKRRGARGRSGLSFRGRGTRGFARWGPAPRGRNAAVRRLLGRAGPGFPVPAAFPVARPGGGIHGGPAPAGA